MLEKEIKVLNVQVDQLVEQLTELGATTVYDGHLFDINFRPADQESSFKIRLRKKKSGSVLTFKRRVSGYENGKIKVREEYEYEVDRNETLAALAQTSLKPKSTKFKQRISLRIDKVHFDIDIYPSLPPILEIEAPTEEAIFARIKKLELEEHQQLSCGTKGLFKHYGFKKLSTYA